MANELELFGTVTSAWNTRPAAPVEGLDTVLERPYLGSLVARSQAEAIIAAKDAELKAAQEHGDMWFKDYSDLRETFKLSEIERKKLEADNAALTARVKELDHDLTEKRRDRIGDSEKGGAYLCRAENAEAKAEALETQLAAAREGAVREIDGYTEYFRGLEKLPRSYVLRGMAELKRRVISTLEAKP